MLDTHALLWLLWGDQHLSSTAREVIDDRENSVFISVASLWEMAIKISLGKLKVDGPFEVAVLDLLAPHFIETLPIGSGHLVDLVDLPHRHRDPFDRLLAAQCRADPLKIVSADKVFDQYGVERIW